MAEEENVNQADAGEAKDSDGGTNEGEVSTADKSAEDSADAGEAARTQPGGDSVLRDPKTGEPLRDQTVAAADTGYLGNHSMQDDTEKIVLEKPDDSDFAE